MKHQSARQGQTTTPGTTCSLSFNRYVKITFKPKIETYSDILWHGLQFKTKVV